MWSSKELRVYLLLAGLLLNGKERKKINVGGLPVIYFLDGGGYEKGKEENCCEVGTLHDLRKSGENENF